MLDSTGVLISTNGKNVRYFSGPPESCLTHPWDAIILRDCGPNTGSHHGIDSIASRKWDILVMKMCEDMISKQSLMLHLDVYVCIS